MRRIDTDKSLVLFRSIDSWFEEQAVDCEDHRPKAYQRMKRCVSVFFRSKQYATQHRYYQKLITCPINLYRQLGRLCLKQK